jgi:hypothetical protein
MSYLDSSHFFDRFRNIICRIPVYGFKDIKYLIYLFIVIYLLYSLEFNIFITYSLLCTKYIVWKFKNQ